jgi:hypothetical protein
MFDDVTEDAHVDRSLGQTDAFDRPLAHDWLAEPGVRAGHGTRRVFDARHLIAAPLGHHEQVAQTAAHVEKAPAAAGLDIPTEVAFEAIEVGRRRCLFQAREFVRVLIAPVRAGAEEVVVVVDGRELLVRRLRISRGVASVTRTIGNRRE